MSTDGFDDLIENAWREFAATVTSRVPDLGRKEFLEIARQDGQRYRVLLVFTKTGSGKVRCTLDGTALPWAGRAEWIRIRGRLAQLGWRFLPRKGQHIAESGQRDASTVADIAVSTLREIFDVAHPVFVTVNNPFGTHSDAGQVDETAAATERQLTVVPQAPDRNVEPPTDEHYTAEMREMAAAMDALPECIAPGFVISGVDELLEVTRSVLARHFGWQVSVVNGCIELPVLDAVPCTIVGSDVGPSLVLTTTLTHRLLDPALLGTLTAEYSSRWSGITFVVHDQHVYAQRVVDAAVFHPHNLDAALRTWRRFLNNEAGELIDALNSGGPGAHTCTQSSVPVGLQTLFELGFSEALTPERVLHLTNGKVGRLTDYLRVCRELLANATVLAAESRIRGAASEEIELHTDTVDFYRQFCLLLEQAITRATPKGA
ncbi:MULTISPECIES: TY-Chap domain-containing protein [unclassified Gordonia (in: high G+C Gram-positive bacteria)]|uniref:TY-Chap domain-containing protein n=1 Tax=unclassified Gordonia (in: high G+C Gram-positive bacteria) TaxID=2657482 RepID=UPI0007E927A4|nr:MULTISPECIES: hypothetical protein [unclassified Gordonia (in: high G+C Gram-positive bacteria)]OBC04728.1 hypothetical protein A5785_14315 [Gordonia sp. 852002-50395_SCH5434458]OBC04907.1 hypothetical protein A5786_12120 [Gordonia sp. 852002-50816_SCH5313054-a]OBC20634.1 hypothetical protein A5788_05890 [Gordonia sp. 852002-50816_SCH5313054-c]